MKVHLLQAQNYWKNIISPGDSIIDATMGRGYDTYFLAQLLQGTGSLTAYDIQEQALLETKKRLTPLPPLWKSNVVLKLKSHSTFEEDGVKLIVYNLGYLPGGNKAITTMSESTLQSIKSGLQILKPKGALSIMCYPGHEEGAREERLLLNFLEQLSSATWNVCYHCWLNRPQAPRLIWIEGVPDA